MSGTYIDSEGNQAETMSYAAALEILHGLAKGNLPDEHDIARDPALATEQAWQVQALDTLEDLVVNLHEEIDDAFVPAAEHGEWTVEAMTPDRGDDPSNPVLAIRIAVSMASNALPDPASLVTDEQVEEYRSNRQAVDLAEDLVGFHGEQLQAAVRTVRFPTFN